MIFSLHMSTLSYPSEGAAVEEGEEENYSTASVPAVLMMVFQYTDNSGQYSTLEMSQEFKKSTILNIYTV